MKANSGVLARPASADGGRETVVERLRRGIAEAGLNCRCKHAANDVLDRVGAEEELIRRARGLADARKMRDAIVAVLALLGEIDELDASEQDRTVFQEIAALFQDVSDYAAHGVVSARWAAGEGNA